MDDMQAELDALDLYSVGICSSNDPIMIIKYLMNRLKTYWRVKEDLEVDLYLIKEGARELARQYGGKPPVWSCPTCGTGVPVRDPEDLAAGVERPVIYPA